jgi:hypothetical protein
MKLNRRKSLKGMLVLGLAVGMKYPSVGAEISTGNMYESQSSLKALKETIPFVSKWWNVAYRGATFVVCLQDFPSYGQSRHSVHAWKQASDGSVNLVWSLRTEGTIPLKVIINEAAGKVSVERSDIKDSLIAFVELAAIAG